MFADIDPLTWNLDALALARWLRFGRVPKLRAVFPVHLYGQSSDMDALEALASEFQFTVIEDAAQAIGAGGNGRAAGTLRKAAAYGRLLVATGLSVSYTEHCRASEARASQTAALPLSLTGRDPRARQGGGSFT